MLLVPPSPRWCPLGADSTLSTPQVGVLVAFEHQVWRVVSSGECPREKLNREQVEALERRAGRRAVRLVLRPSTWEHPDPVALRSKDIVVTAIHPLTWWHVYPSEHFPVCASCSEPLPCREVHGERVAQAEIARMAAYEMAGVCPACREPVSKRQRSITFSENLKIPGGPPLTFHVRSRCFTMAMRYENEWVAADPGRRRHRLSCAGLMTQHGDGSYECTELAECRGPRAYHEGWKRCECTGCRVRPGSEQRWDPKRRREHLDE